MIEGPDIAIGREVAVAMALVLHELATNASKYGALSTAQGRLEVRWSVVGTKHGYWNCCGRKPAALPLCRRPSGVSVVSRSPATFAVGAVRHS